MAVPVKVCRVHMRVGCRECSPPEKIEPRQYQSPRDEDMDDA